MKTREKMQQLEQRQQLLELEAHLQRAALAATLAKWESRRTVALASTLSSMAMRVISQPRVRWLIAASVLSRLRRRRHREHD